MDSQHSMSAFNKICVHSYVEDTFQTAHEAELKKARVPSCNELQDL